MEEKSPLDLARLSLEGLTVGDSFGENFFAPPGAVETAITRRIVPQATWYMTDDSIMALGIFEVLERHGVVDQDDLAATFARNYRRNPGRGYGGMAHRILQAVSTGADWREVSSAAFGGLGSYGNGGAMRVAPLGAFFSSQGLDMVAEQARLSAKVTHYHPEGQAGAIAIAIGAAQVCSSGMKPGGPTGREILEAAQEYTPEGDTRSGIQRAMSIPMSSEVESAVSALGNGSRVSAPDTVPFCLWCAARHIDNYEEALWTTVSGLGDRDTTCAIVGGIVSLATGLEGIPRKWLHSREPLFDWE